MSVIEVRDPSGVVLGSLDCVYPALTTLTLRYIAADNTLMEVTPYMSIPKKAIYADFYCCYRQNSGARYPMLVTEAPVDVLKQLKSFKLAA